MKKSVLIKLTLLVTSMMTMMAGAVVAPSLPQINKVFADVAHADILTRLILTLPALFMAVFSPIYGFLADKYGRKKFLIFALILYGVSGTSGYYLNDLYLILIGRAFLGIAVAGIMTIVVTLVGDYYSGDERNGFVGLQGAFMGLGGVFFITVAGLLADVHWQMPFLIYAFAFPMLAAVVIFIYEPEIIKKKQNKASKSQSDPGYSRLMVTILLMIVFIGVVFFYMMPVQMPYILKNLEGINNSMVGYAIAVSTLFSAIVAMNYKRIKKRFSFPLIYMFTFFFMAVGYGVIAISDSYAYYIVGLMISGLGTGLLMPTGNLWMMEIAPPSMRGRLIGQASTAAFLGMFLSPIIIQPLINYGAISFAFEISAIVMAGLSIAFILIRNTLKRLSAVSST